MHPTARKLRAPRGGWPSHCSEFVIGDEPNRFRYVVGESYKLSEPPGQGPRGLRRLFAVLEGKRGQAVALFEELPERPR